MQNRIVTVEEFRLAITGGNNDDTVNLYIEQNRGDVAKLNESLNQHNETALILAVITRNTAAAQALLAIPGLDINHKNVNDVNALMLAASHNMIILVSILLLKQNIDLSAKSNRGTTALMTAAMQGHHEIIFMLLPKMNLADIEQKNNDGQTALELAVNYTEKDLIKKRIHEIQYELNHYVPAQQAGGYRYTAAEFLAAADKGADQDFLKVKWYIEQNRDDIDKINVVDHQDNNALSKAVRRNDYRMISILLSVPNSKLYDEQRGSRILRTANDHYKLNAVILLLPKLNLQQINYVFPNSNKTVAQEAQAQGRLEISTVIQARVAEILAVEALANLIVVPHDQPIVLLPHQLPAVMAPVVQQHAAASGSAPAKQSFKQQLKDIYYGELPEHLTCRISGEVMEDPITLPSSGLTFDRSSLVGWFAQKGNPFELPWPEANGITMKLSELTVAPSKIILNLIRDFIEDQRENHKNKKSADNDMSNEGKQRFSDSSVGSSSVAIASRSQADSKISTVIEELLSMKKAAEETIIRINHTLDLLDHQPGAAAASSASAGGVSQRESVAEHRVLFFSGRQAASVVAEPIGSSVMPK